MATRIGTPDRGPYLDTEFDYLQPIRTEEGQLRVAPQIQRLYLSAAAIMAYCAQPGSPIVAIPASQHATLLAKAAELEAANDRLAELESKVSEREENGHVDPGQIADALRAALPSLIAEFDDRYSRKRGAKKAA